MGNQYGQGGCDDLAALRRLAEREARVITMTARGAPPPVAVLPVRCAGCGGSVDEARRNIANVPFGDVAVHPAADEPSIRPVTIVALGCERLTASALTLVAHVAERVGTPLRFRTRSATAAELMGRGGNGPSLTDILRHVDRSETWLDALASGRDQPSGHQGAVCLPVTLGASGDAARSDRIENSSPFDVDYVRTICAPFLLPHVAEYPASVVDDAYHEFRSGALWKLLSRHNRTFPVDPRVPGDVDYASLRHPRLNGAGSRQLP
jgi:hypothetical protein